MMKHLGLDCALLLAALFLASAPGTAQEPRPPASTAPPPSLIPLCPPSPWPGHHQVFEGPILTETPAAPRLAAARLEPDDKGLPINLATALRLAGARPVVIEAAQASVEVAAAELARARVAWLPSVYFGAGYYHHDGGTQGQSGNFYVNTKYQFEAGGGAVLRFSATDAIFSPLAARQVLRSRDFDLQTARNEALLAVADAYFRVQQASGRVAGSQDVLEKARGLHEKVLSLAKETLDPTDVHRAMAAIAEIEGTLDTAREQWRLASADLTQVLRLDPSAVVVPLEPPFLRVTLVCPKEQVDNLVPIGLTNRPELASQQALVQASQVRIKQERIRPLLPSVIVEGGSNPSAPGGYMMGGIFGSGASGTSNPWVGRDDIGIGIYWGLDNLGLGNRAQVRTRRGEQQQLLVELSRLQDLVAGDVVRAHASLVSAAARTDIAATGLQEAQLSYKGSLEELGKITKVGDVKLLTHHAFEVVDALRALLRAYDNYFISINDYNRAQFRLYRALGYPAEIVACERTPGQVLPVDTSRPPQMAPVCPSDPCPGHR